MTLYVEGLLLGVPPVFFVGPVLFTLLEAALAEGVAAGAAVAAGIALSDVVALGLVVLGLGPVLAHPTGAFVLGVLGGVLLVGFGVALSRSTGELSQPHTSAVSVAGHRGLSRLVRHGVAGFAVNFINPFVFAFWVGIVGVVSARHGAEAGVVWPVLAGMVSTIFATDLLKAWGAARLSAMMSSGTLLWVRRGAGLLLAGSGLVVLVRTVWGLS